MLLPFIFLSSLAKLSLSAAIYKKLNENNFSSSSPTIDGLVYSNVAAISLLLLLTVYQKNVNINSVNVELLNIFVSLSFYILYFTRNVYTKNLLISTIALDGLLFIKVCYDIYKYVAGLRLAMREQNDQRISYDFKEFNDEMNKM